MKRILVLGGDGYCGWPTALHLSAEGHEVAILDNFVRRQYDHEMGCESITPIAPLFRRIDAWRDKTGKEITAYVADLCDGDRLVHVLKDFEPHAVVHFAEQRAAPYSMIDRRHAVYTHQDNVVGTLNLMYAIKEVVPDCHIVKLGTMGEYGTPNIDIEEGWIEIEYKGRRDRLLYPKRPNSWYHLTKVHDSANLEFACRIWGLRVTDLNQGVVYGTETPEVEYSDDIRLVNRLDYDGIFGTALNRFCVQAVLGLPISVYGKGGQTRGFINIVDTTQCVRLAIENPAKNGEFRVFNQFTEQWNVLELARLVKQVGSESFGIDVSITRQENPRAEAEEHYYNATTTLTEQLGLKSNLLTKEVIEKIITQCINFKERCDPKVIISRIDWRQPDNWKLSGFIARSG